MGQDRFATVLAKSRSLDAIPPRLSSQSHSSSPTLPAIHGNPTTRLPNPISMAVMSSKALSTQMSHSVIPSLTQCSAATSAAVPLSWSHKSTRRLAKFSECHPCPPNPGIISDNCVAASSRAVGVGVIITTGAEGGVGVGVGSSVVSDPGDGVEVIVGAGDGSIVAAPVGWAVGVAGGVGVSADPGVGVAGGVGVSEVSGATVGVNGMPQAVIAKARSPKRMPRRSRAEAALRLNSLIWLALAMSVQDVTSRYCHWEGERSTAISHGRPLGMKITCKNRRVSLCLGRPTCGGLRRPRCPCLVGRRPRPAWPRPRRRWGPRRWLW